MQSQSIIPVKSPNDKRTYQAIVLSNKLKVLFIHDEQIVKSACSISVGVGSMFDTERSLGLAHFLQHMLFMGSKKYPSHNQYSSFISTNSGFDNAYTSDLETNYYFQIKNSSFNQAVQRLTNFFNGALLKEQCIQKQSQAVHQQYILWTNDDNCRKWQVLRKLATPPYSRFTIGNKQTLRHEHIRQDLVEFYNRYYSANIINAVFCSTIPINQMKSNFIPLLEAIQNKQVILPQLQLHFTKQQTGKLVQMQSIKDQTIMEYFWVIQYLKPQYKKHISDYITHVVGHQGKNSLLSILKAKKYASELSAYSHDLKNQSLIGTEIKLTEQGSQNYQQVYNIVMDYMSTLKYEQYIFEQIKQKKLLQFKFKEKTKVSQYVCKLSSKMHDLPLHQVLNAGALFDEYDPAAINRILGQLNPFNVIIVLSSNQELENPLIQKYLGAKYLVQNLPQRQKSGIEFKPLLQNIFIPIDTNIHPSVHNPAKIPIKIGQNIYFLQDSSFRVCKGGIQLRIYNQENFQFNQFYCNYLNLLLKQFTYPAESLQCNIQYEPDDCIIITIFGFSDTVMKLIEGMADQINNIHGSQHSKALFEVALQDLIETYENFYNQQSDEVAEDTIDTILTNGLNTISKTLQQLQSYTYENIIQRAKKFWRNNILRWVVVGNFEERSISKILQKVQLKLHSGLNSQINIPETNCLKVSSNIVHQVHLESEELSSSCAIVYYQAGEYSQELYYKLLLLKNHIDEPFFNQLRTQKQMAYYLAARIQNVRGILGLRFILVSSTRDPKDISIQIKNFVQNFFSRLNQDLAGVNQSSFTKIKQSVFTKINSPHNNLKALFQFVAQQINEKTYFFTRKEQKQIKRYLEHITVNDLIKTWECMKNTTLDLYVVSKSHLQAYQKHDVKGESVEEIRQKHKFWKDLFYVGYNNQK